MNDYISVCYGNNVLVHHGIKGQKWGIRRFQNEDGSLTDAGTKRYSSKEETKLDRYRTKLAKKALRKSKSYDRAVTRTEEDIRDMTENGLKSDTYKSMVSDRREQEKRDYERDQEWSNSNLESALLKADRMIDLGKDVFRNRDSELQTFMNEKASEASKYKEKSSQWLERNKALMSLDISQISSKKELKNIYRNK